MQVSLYTSIPTRTTSSGADFGRGYVPTFPPPKKGDTAPKISEKQKRPRFGGHLSKMVKGKGTPLPVQTVGAQGFEGSRQR